VDSESFFMPHYIKWTDYSPSKREVMGSSPM
jgi:hypothetical protein